MAGWLEGTGLIPKMLGAIQSATSQSHNVDNHPANNISKMPVDAPPDGSVHEDFAHLIKTSLNT